MIEVKSPINLKQIGHARQWAAEAMKKRPYRKEFFNKFSEELTNSNAKSVIELGSGPGFLVQAILNQSPNIEYSAFDFSNVMHIIAKERLGDLSNNVKFVEGSFQESGWEKSLGKYDAVLSLQAIHEIRHKDKVPLVFSGVKSILRKNGIFLFCDHVCDVDGMEDDQLYMNEEEQLAALNNAGFNSLGKLLRIGSMVLWKGYA